MQWLSENWFFLVVLALCGGMHLFGHGHQGGRASDDEGGSRGSADKGSLPFDSNRTEGR